MSRLVPFVLLLAATLAMVGAASRAASGTAGPARLAGPTPAASRAAPEPPAEKALFHSDPEHVWNRLHRHVFLRDDKNVSVDDREPLSSVTAQTSAFLTKGKSHQEAVALLDEFLKVAPDRQLKEPLKRAVLQHDLWEAFTATTQEARLFVFSDVNGRLLKDQHYIDPGDAGLDDRKQRRDVQKRLAQAMRAVALSPREIEALRDNFADAVKAGTFPKEFDPEHPEKPFLPPDLLAKDGPWVAVASLTRSDELAAPAHMAATKGRAVFTVFLRLPEGRKATEAFLKRMKDGALPELPEGAQTALLRRWLLIDDQGRPCPTPLTESLQLRVYWKDDVGRPYVFRMHRSELFAGHDGGIKPVSIKNEDCRSCHAQNDGQGVRTIATLYAGEPTKRGLIAVGAGEQSGKTVDWLKTTYTWGLLQGLWETEPPK
jgi:hypothetical protein